MPHWTALVTIVALLVYFSTTVLVARARPKFGILAPAITGNPQFERIFRVQMNTLEWLPIFLPLLWLFAFYVGDAVAAVLGLIWCGARVHYIVGYTAAADKRGTGFGIQAAVCLILLAGALAKIVVALAH